MRAGLLNEIIEIWRPFIYKNEVGASTTVWKKDEILRANVKHNNMNRSVQVNEVFYDQTKIFTVRRYVDIDENCRIKYQDKFYRIISIDSNRELNQKTIICDRINE